MDQAIVRGLCDRQYEIRKKAALQLEKQIKFIYYEEQNVAKLTNIIKQLTEHSTEAGSDSIENENIKDYQVTSTRDFTGATATEAGGLESNENHDDDGNIQMMGSDNPVELTAVSHNQLNNDVEDNLGDREVSSHVGSVFPVNVDVTTVRIAKLMAYASIIISLGQTNSTPFINQIIPAMLPFFYDPNDLVRFYSCESLYNIAKILKGEILIYFNEIFDILCSVTVDPINNVKGAAGILDKLMKDIVIEFGSDYISFLQVDDDILNTTTNNSKASFIGNKLSSNMRYKDVIEQHKNGMLVIGGDFVQPANSKLRQPSNGTLQLNKFIPLLLERIYSNNNNTKVFLLSWIEVLNKCPNLTLVTFLPWLINAILLYLDDTVNNEELTELVNNLLSGMIFEVQNLGDIRMRQFNKEQVELINNKKKLVANNKRVSSLESNGSAKSLSRKRVIDGGMSIQERKKSLIINNMNIEDELDDDDTKTSHGVEGNDDFVSLEEPVNEPNNVTENLGEEYVNKPYLDIKKLTSTLIKSLSSSNQKIQKLVMNWISVIITHWPIDDIVHVAKTYDSNNADVKDQDLSELITLLLKLGNSNENKLLNYANPDSLFDTIKYIDNMRQKTSQHAANRDAGSKAINATVANAAYKLNYKLLELLKLTQDRLSATSLSLSLPITSLVNNLVLTFKESNYENKILILNWLSFVYSNFIDEHNCDHFNDNCFLILVKALNYEDGTYELSEDGLGDSTSSMHTQASELGASDANELSKNKEKRYVFLLTKSLNLLKLINSLVPNDSYFNKFLTQLLNNWEGQSQEKGNKRDVVFTNLCNALGAEKIYKHFSLLLDSRYKLKKNYVFTSEVINMMAKKLIITKELYPLRTKLRMNDDWTFFSILFKAWCIQPSALVFLCLVSENYELGYNIILGLTSMEDILPKNLVQLDILVQLMESQALTQMRMDLLLMDKQHLIKMLYSILMLLPQSSNAYTLLSNRLNVVSQFKNMCVEPQSALKPLSPQTSTRSLSSSSSKSIITTNSFQFADLMEYYTNVINNI